MSLRTVLIIALVSGCAVETRSPGVNGDYESRPFEQPAPERCDDGAISACSLELGRNAGIVSCFTGQKVCRDGVWSVCGALDGGTVDARHVGDRAEDEPSAQVKSLSQAGGGKGLCATNPCDMTCIGYDERPTQTITGTAVVSSWYGNITGFGGSPPGFIDKLVREPCSAPADCGYDMHCEASTRKCVANLPGWTYAAGVCGAPNLSVGAACEVAGRTKLPVCNRGNVAIPAGQVLKLAIKNGNWITAPSCPVVAAADLNCAHTLATPLYPGACVTVDTCGISGNSVAFVNGDYAVSECAGKGMTIGCVDNWSDVKVVPCSPLSLTSYLPKTFTETYVAKCPISSRPVWQFLTYTGTAPTNSTGSASIKFAAEVAPVLDNGSIGAYSVPVTVADTRAGDPATCQPGATACPKNVFTALGGDPLAYRAALKLTVTLTPTPDNLLTPSLRDWQLNYSCVAVE